MAYEQATLDHVIPWAKGGKGHSHNLVVACKKCNQKKKDLTLEEFREIRRDLNQQRNGMFYGEIQ